MYTLSAFPTWNSPKWAGHTPYTAYTIVQVCMYVYIIIYMYVYICMHVCMYVYMYAYIYMPDEARDGRNVALK